MTLLRPYLNRLRKLAGSVPDFWGTAEETWEAAPGGEVRQRPAVFLSGQMERIRTTAFGNRDVIRDAFTADCIREAGPTLAARFRDVDLFDGVLYKRSAEFHLQPRQRRLGAARRLRQIASGAIYDSWIGLRYFGNWLMDDCETYRLAETAGQPVTTRLHSNGHRSGYEARLGMMPHRIDEAHFETLVLFQDLSNNPGKCARAADRRRRLVSGAVIAPHPGVFLLRAGTGETRLLRNEAALAEALSHRYGIRALSAEEMSVDELVTACAGARLVIGVEGSHMTHGIASMPDGGTVLALMPPDRVTAALKMMTDRLGLRFAFVIGSGTVGGFEVALSEVEATLDLLA